MHFFSGVTCECSSVGRRNPPLNGWETPEVYANYYPGAASPAPYYGGIGAAADHLVNFFNPVDNALQWWDVNQDTKPDERDGYTYGPLAHPNSFIGPIGRILSFPDDTYEIFAHAAEARSRALGAQPSVAGPFHVGRELDLQEEFGFTNSADDHSGQFYSTLMRRHPYWRALLTSFGL